MVQYKLIYFNGRGRAEPIRMMFKYAKVPFEDFRVEGADWPKVKETMPWGQMPVLEVDGVRIAQTATIGRFLAPKLGLAGENDIEAAKIDEYGEALGEFALAVYQALYVEKDETKKADMAKTLKEETMPKFLNKITAILEKNGTGFLVGKKLSSADISFANFMENIELQFKLDLSPYPVIKKHEAFVLGQPGIKEWHQSRPTTPF